MMHSAVLLDQSPGALTGANVHFERLDGTATTSTTLSPCLLPSNGPGKPLRSVFRLDLFSFPWSRICQGFCIRPSRAA